ncbi:reverse transcriptase domain-containing protein [Buttiauxella noackiae]|uniref:reverse transcriptase domain-containing protein n=1 Tax=Buttiauxella noackiae TaxID=82992 RepID=UPI0005544AF4|nr:reverse transcriptase domain-containing protein [Buttiauxella noackiae]
MNIYEKFLSKFSEQNLKLIFDEYILYSGATGIDNLDSKGFKKQLDEQIAILSRKIYTGSYCFTKYKLKLASKGRGKSPREISIPTVRDRIALRAMNDLLTEVFKPTLEVNLPQATIRAVKNSLSKKMYTGYIKLDVSNFYPSIQHSELKSRLRKRIKSEQIINLIESAITSPTVITSSHHDEKSSIGVPQGLAVSNVLASIYMINIDNYLKSISNIDYYRYVDDVLIFCDYSEAQMIANDIITRFRRIGLTVHDPIKMPEKSSIERIGCIFNYLGYQFDGERVSARKATIEKLKHSLAAIFTAHKHSRIKNEEFLLWRLDLRITGCVFENKSKGWLFFFSEINDKTLLHELDHYIRKLLKRFNVSITPKRFSRAFEEMVHRRYETKYIPNFDDYQLKEKLALLHKYFPKDVEGQTLTEEQITYRFHRRIGKQAKDLLEDVKNFRS